MNAGRVDGCCWLAEWANWRGLHRWQLGGRTVEQINILESRLCVRWESLPWRGCRVTEKLGYSWLLWVIYLLQLLYLSGIRCMFHTASCIKRFRYQILTDPSQQAQNAAVIIHLYYFPLWECNIYTRDALSGMLIIRKVIKCLLPWRGSEQRGAEAAARPSPGLGGGIESVTGEKTFWSIFLLATLMNSPFLRLPEVDGQCCSCWSALLQCWLRSGRCGSTSCCCEDELAGLMGGRPMHI